MADAAGETILRLLRDPALAAKMGETGRDYAVKHTWAWFTGEVVGLYQTTHGASAVGR